MWLGALSTTSSITLPQSVLEVGKDNMDVDVDAEFGIMEVSLGFDAFDFFEYDALTAGAEGVATSRKFIFVCLLTFLKQHKL